MPAARPTATLSLRHFIGLDGLPREVIEHLLDQAELLAPVARGEAPRCNDLDGRTVATIFLENSTRTRASFSIAARKLGADVLDLSGDSTSRSKGETLLDTCRNLQAMGVDCFIIRTSASGDPHQVAKHLEKVVINAGDGRHEHPTQGLLDLMTLREKLGDLKGRTIGIVGDIANSRVARSAIFGLTTLGANVLLIGPPALAPRSFEEIVRTVPPPAPSRERGSVSVSRDFDDALRRVDALIMLRVQFERAAGESIASIEEYRTRYALTAKRAAMMQDHAVVLHPGPINRGIEIESDVADDPHRSVILQQVSNGVAIRMAVLRATCA
jgi:aspartate carbamoyltransferase catalytic subunit